MGEQKLFFDDVTEGDAAPEFAHELTRTDLVMYAGASGDFNPMHHDEVAAQAAGCRACSGTACSPPGMLGKALTDYVGVGNLRLYKIRFTKQTWPGETLTTHVTVAKKYEEGTRAPGRPRVLGHRTRTARPSSPGVAVGRAARALTPDPKAADRDRACASTSRTPDLETQPFWDARPRGQARSSSAATRAASTTSTRGRSARSAGATTSSGSRRAAAPRSTRGRSCTANDLPPFRERVPVRRRGRRPRRRPAHDDQRRRLRVRRPRRSAWRSRWCSTPLATSVDHRPVPAGGLTDA